MRLRAATYWTVLGLASVGALPAQTAQPPNTPPAAPQSPANNSQQFFQQLQQLRNGANRQGPASPQAVAPATAAQPLAPAAEAKPSPGIPAMMLPTAARRPSMLDDPATAPTLLVEGNALTIVANNSSLNEVLRQVAARTGMQVEGAQHDERIFGTYGPGKPADVLSSLLYDSGYNVMMVGTPGGSAPSRLVLSARVTAPAGQAAAVSANHARDEEDDETTPQPPTNIFGRPPEGAPPAQQNQNQPRTPQQMLEELQRLRQAQNNGQTPPTENQGQTQP